MSLCIVLLLGGITFFDFRDRMIPVWMYMLLAIFIVIQGLSQVYLDEIIYYSIINILLIVLMISGVYLWFLLKNRKYTPILNHYLGTGDVLFWLLVCFYLSPLIFIAVQLITITVSLLAFGVLKLLDRNINTTIPLAGIQAVFISLLELGRLLELFAWQFRDDLVINLLV